jgi:hypothetical protein
MKRDIFLRLDRALPWFAVLYYLEIMYFMVTLLFMAGKTVAATVSGILALLLAVHIFMIYFKRPASRIMQLALMDLHCAYSVPFVLSLVMSGAEYSTLDTVFMALRLLMAAAELAFIFALTDEHVKQSYA